MFFQDSDYVEIFIWKFASRNLFRISDILYKNSVILENKYETSFGRI